MIQILGEQNSIFNRFIYEIRDQEIQKDSMRFRRNLQRIGEIFAYEISKKLNFVSQDCQTPLGIANITIPTNQIVIASILRAGLPIHEGFLNYFDNAGNAFISAYRNYDKDGSFDIKIEYCSSPNIDNKVVILTDAMLATGSSMVLAYKALLEKGTPAHTHIVSIIASNEGVDYLRKRFSPNKFTIWLGAIDDELTVKSYIVPGLGDAGDLAYGDKI